MAEANAGKALTVEIEGSQYSRIPIRTRVVMPGDDLDAFIREYATDVVQPLSTGATRYSRHAAYIQVANLHFFLEMGLERLAKNALFGNIVLNKFRRQRNVQRHRASQKSH